MSFKQQSILSLKWDKRKTFDNYFPGGNGELIEQLKKLVAKPPVENQDLPVHSMTYFYGDPGLGASHLLQACCHKMTQQQGSAVYIPLADSSFEPAVLEGLEGVDLICLDAVDVVLGEAKWEQALFHLFNRVKQKDSSYLVMSARTSPQTLAGDLADLVSRLSSMLVYRLVPLSDEEKVEALISLAHRRGIQMYQEVAKYIVHHYPRDMLALTAMLERLDLAMLQKHRRLTIPFVKQVEPSLS